MKLQRRYIVVFIFCCFAAYMNILYFITKYSLDINRGQITGAKSKAIKVILLWNSLWTKPTWGLSKSIFSISGNGADEKCIFTNQTNFLPTIDKYDAIIFHPAVWFEYPNVRDVRQKYIFATAEAPAYFCNCGVSRCNDFKNKKSFYNITMTYRFDSDVLWFYGFVREVETNVLIAPAENPFWRKPDLENFVPNVKLQQLISGKTKSAIWFVSHCNTTSRREELVVQLKKHLQVDIFGECFNGSMSCLHWTKECFESLDKQYKFFLSFENALSIDYVTEKLFNALNRTIVPIVYGGADYNRFAPPHSYIDAQDFINATELAEYLIYLEKNTTAYGEYFWWKSFYKIEHSLASFNFPMVVQDLCHYLHKAENQIQYYENIEDHFLRGCKTYRQAILP